MVTKRTGRMTAVAVLLGGLWALGGLARTADTEPRSDTIAGVLDGEEREWFILERDGDSNAGFIDMGGGYRVDILGFVDPEAWVAQEGLSIGMTIVDGEVTEFDVHHLVGPTALPPVYTAEGGEVSLILESFEVEGAVARVAGRVEGRLAWQESLEAEPDLDAGLDLSVAFAVEAERVEF